MRGEAGMKPIEEERPVEAVKSVYEKRIKEWIVEGVETVEEEWLMESVEPVDSKWSMIEAAKAIKFVSRSRLGSCNHSYPQHKRDS